jgi:hypothetical protein
MQELERLGNTVQHLGLSPVNPVSGPRESIHPQDVRTSGLDQKLMFDPIFDRAGSPRFEMIGPSPRLITEALVLHETGDRALLEVKQLILRDKGLTGIEEECAQGLVQLDVSCC